MDVEQSDHNNMEFIQILSSTHREYRNLGVSGMRTTVKFKQPPDNDDDWSNNCINELINSSKSELSLEGHDKVGFSFNNTENEKISFNISFRRFDQYSSELILSALNNVLQSNTNFLHDDNLIINIDAIKMPIGYGRKTFIGKNSVDFYKIHKNSIFVVY